ncbi:MAG: two-component sensor histidine kinase, partial [Hyphomicrobium sp.]
MDLLGPFTNASGRAGRAFRSFADAAAPALEQLRAWQKGFFGLLADSMPKGLYARALIIIIAPIVVLEGVIAFVFMERHWQNVTRRLSETTARDISALIEFYDKSTPTDYDEIIRIARDRLNLSMQILPPGDLPEARQKPFFDLLDRALSREISRQVKRPFWIDTVGQSRHVEIRVQHADSILRFLAVRTQTYASNSHIFLLWMVGSSVILLTVAILFLRN